jgi:hypothetical protein
MAIPVPAHRMNDAFAKVREFLQGLRSQCLASKTAGLNSPLYNTRPGCLLDKARLPLHTKSGALQSCSRVNFTVEG